MDIVNDAHLEFLDFTGVKESQKKWLESCLYSATANHPLPWIITQKVPSLMSKRRTQNSLVSIPATSSDVVNTSVTLNGVSTEQVNSNGYIPRPQEQGQFQPVYGLSSTMTPKFPVPPGPYPGPYPAAVMPIPSIYANFHHSPQALRNGPSALISPAMYTQESYAYSQVSPVAASYDNLPQFTHNPQFGSNRSAIVPSQHNGAAPVIMPEQILPPNTNIHQQSQHIHTAIVTSPNVIDNVDSVAEASPLVSLDMPVTNESLKNNVQKVIPDKPTVHPSPTVSYGVPNSSPFPASKETNLPVYPSPSLNKTEIKKNDSKEIDSDQNIVITNGHNGVENSTSVNKSWASLFNKESSGGVSCTVKSNNDALLGSKDNENGNGACPIKNPRKSQFIDPTTYRMGEYLLSHVLDGRTISLQPRGLINRSNYCYINSILQALLACPPLYNLLSGLAKNINSNGKRKPTPVIDSMCKLIDEFEHLPAGQRVGRRTEKNQKKEAGVLINCGIPFEATWIYKMLSGMRSDSFLIEGRQEDAEEFFGCLLNGMNDEIQELMKAVSDDCDDGREYIPEPNPDTEDWHVMGPKNKGSITRKMVFGRTPISNIFGGLLRSKIYRAGDESSNNIQPFFTLQLNIAKANTVYEALEALVSKNQLEGVKSSKTNEQVEAWQQVTIEELPVVLVLHFKCFDYQLNGCTKITKKVEFPVDLKIDSKLLSSKMSSTKEKQYKLFAVVYHDGKEASKGHYLTDAFHVGYNSWLRYDDAAIKAISEQQVLTAQGCRVPYLLFYRRCDTIRSK